MVLVALTLTLLAVVLQSAHSRAQPTVAAPATNIARPEVASPDQAAAQGGATERDGGAAANELSVEPPKPPSADPAVLALERLVTDITAFVGGELDVSREPQSLFDVPFSDDAAIAVAAKRLRVLIAAEQTEVTELEGAVTDAGIAAPGDGRDGGVGEDAVDGSEEVEQLDEALWNAQLDVDRARLRFYQMPADERAAIIDKHVARQRDASEREQNAAEARRKAKEAEDALKTAEEAAQKADTAVDQRIKDEVVRIKKLAVDNAALQAELLQREQALDEPPEWANRAAEIEQLLQRLDIGADSGEAAKAAYMALDTQLQLIRATLSLLLDSYPDGESAVKEAGQGPLVDLDPVPPSVDAARAELAVQVHEIRPIERRVNMAERQRLTRGLEQLNQLRLVLLPELPRAMRADLLGFGPVGRAEAEKELKLVDLVVSSHVSASKHWLAGFEFERYAQSSRLDLTWTAIKWFALLTVFVWWHRRAGGWLETWAEGLREQQPRRLGRERLVRFLRRVRRPLEWLLFFAGVQALLPGDARRLLEVELVGIILAWFLGEAIVVNGLDALVGWRGAHATRNEHIVKRRKVRLRSLHIVGQSTVLVGMTLSLVARLVGRGTIYTWLFYLGAAAALPLGLVIVHLWRPIIFRRVRARRKHNAVTRFVTANQHGWATFVAALVGAVYLSLRGIERFFRRYVLGFELIRRLRAYWFRREVSKREESEELPARAMLSPEKIHALHPEAAAEEIVPSVADPQLDDVIECIQAPGGGVFAVVGERGSGKTTLLRRIEARCKAHIVRCPAAGMAEFMPALSEALGSPQDAPYTQISQRVNKLPDDSAILVDDAHHLIRPVIGGLDDFDQLLRIARDSSVGACTWVFVIDAVVWQFFELARGAKPLFDDVIRLRPWAEDGVARLLRSVSQYAGLDPNFDQLLTDLARDADDFTRADALARAEANYYRLLWDYSRGNPAVALHFWQCSLECDAKGGETVRLFRPPFTNDLDELPDSAVFVLRSVLQLDRASIDDVVRATRLAPDRVHDALRYALARGYLELERDRYRVSWQWFRALNNFLERRHLLVPNR